MSEYSSLKVPELKKLLQEKSLPVTGNKADLIARLQEHDKANAAPARENEDEIDYSDDEVPATTQSVEPTKPEEPAEAVAPVPVAPPVEEKKQPAEPAEPVESVKDAAADPATVTDEPAEAAPEDPAAPEAPKTDFSAHLPASTVNDEARKRAERAKRFGLVEDEEEKRKTARVERFGVDESSLVQGLDAALPERRPAKRGREGANADADRGAKRQNPGARQRGRGRFRQAGGSRPGVVVRKEGKPNAPRGKVILDDPTERAKAEARAKRFGGA
ncbi:hypothetical protein GGS23DRAFT_426072 [Durotheca rogersii]|uniref:uncharacterized protein n=1 Tax=Durotheca rogersii TaxID=419775 RepID=UPI0022204179|nr:uncharacterized protein GGS23DRAFT_426072 [Durotheca rogersii]KAI5865416.1 hypothetical protein GGS23DRAFT_426072 [Durotheca rogersii]